MSISLYDEALTEKFKHWTNNTTLQITSPNETTRLFTMIGDQNNDTPIKLPLIAIQRTGGYNLQSITKKAMTFDGITLEASENKSVQLNAIPVSVSYQVDVYTRYLKEADEYTRNLIFNIINYPKLSITLPYKDMHIVHDSSIYLAGEVLDNSDIPERLIAGQFTRLTLKLGINDAYIFDVRTRDNIFIDDKIEII